MTTPGGPSADDLADLAEHPGVCRVREQLSALRASGRVVVLSEHARTAALAAAQLDVEVGQIANSLIFAAPDDDAPDGRRAVLVLTSGAHRVDTSHVAAVLELPQLDRADAAFVRERTGFAIGGVAPVGHLQPVQTLVDVALSQFDVVWAAAGHPRTVFSTRYEELLRITGGQPVEVG